MTMFADMAKAKSGGKNNLLLGQFEIGKMLGRGSFAKVYLARKVDSGEQVAIKAIEKEMIVRSGLVAHIKREIAVLRRVRHPNIVQLHEVMATKSKIYFVMEYVRGGELFARVAKGRLREERARRYFQQLISAVSFCHSRGVFHRDLKPENLLVDENGNLKVSDFGLSAVSDQSRSDGLLHTFCGTPAYLAPEVLSRKGYDGAKVDIWSCGVILYVLMAGCFPFHDPNSVNMYRKIYKGEFRRPRWFSSELTYLLGRLLDTNSKTRITISEIMVDPWFKKGFEHVRFYLDDDEQFHTLDEDQGLEDSQQVQAEEPWSESGSESGDSVASCPATISGDRARKVAIPRPSSLNAFDIISFSRGFDLSGLFEETGERRRFLTREPASKIISELEEIAIESSFELRRKECRLRMERTSTEEGKRVPLSITVELLELAAEVPAGLVVMEVKKKAGDKEEYDEFCRKVLKPRLRHLMCQSPPVSKNSSPLP